MPIRRGGIAARRASIWPRDHFCRSTIAPRRSRPTRWNEFLPISMPIVAMVAIDWLDMAVLRLTLAPSQHHAPVGQEHGRTIPLADIGHGSRGIRPLLPQFTVLVTVSRCGISILPARLPQSPLGAWRLRNAPHQGPLHSSILVPSWRR